MADVDLLLIEEMPLHSIFRTRRRALGLTQSELAERVDTTQSVITAIENGHRTLSATMEEKLRDALRVHPAELVKRHRQRIVEQAHDLGFAAIKVFGSLSRGEATPEDSDVDFFVEFPPDTEHDAFAVLELRRRLENILSLPVDLVSVPKNPEHYGGIYRDHPAAVAL